MLFLPIRTDRRLRATPWVNFALIVVNVVVFLLTRRQIEMTMSGAGPGSSWSRAADALGVTGLYLNPLAPRLFQFLTYQFLHAGPMHLFGNMIFLYVFGNSVEDRLGKVGYLCFYLAGGVLAAIGHMLLEDAPVLGASGSVAAVTGAYLALFPMSNVTVFYWVFLFGTFEISGLALILLQVVENLLLHLFGSGGVAYMAHLWGYGFGFAVGMALLGVRVLPREPYDLLSMLEHRRRRQRFTALTRQGYHPWEHHRAGDAAREAPPRQATPRERQLLERRAGIAQALHAHDLRGAADLYRELLAVDAGQVMGRQQQLDLANALASEGRHDDAARAYELYLNAYRQAADREQVELMLGVIYHRYLGRRQRARELLAAALPRLRDTDQQALARDALAEIG